MKSIVAAGLPPGTSADVFAVDTVSASRDKAIVVKISLREFICASP
jgi:hypothetical protein